MDPLEWQHPEEPPRYAVPGRFVLYARCGGDDHRSFAAWKIEPADTSLEIIEHCRPNGSTDSPHKRGGVAAVARALEALPNGSTAELLSLESYIIDAFERGDLNDWKRRGFRKKRGQLHAADIWRRIDRVRHERQLDIKARHINATRDPVAYGKLGALADLIDQKKVEIGY